jgi:hypothetical protein
MSNNQHDVINNNCAVFPCFSEMEDFRINGKPTGAYRRHNNVIRRNEYTALDLQYFDDFLMPPSTGWKCQSF